MRKVYLITSILLLSSVWLVAQTSPSSSGSATQQPSTDQSSPSTTSPSQTSPSQTYPSTTTQTTTTQTTETSTGTSIEGCLSGSSGNYTLTDTAGKTWQLAGDTSKLTEHVGHQVRLTGSEASGAGAAGAASGASAGAGASGAGSSGTQSTF